MKVLVTGAYGFLGRNLALALEERGDTVVRIGRDDDVGAAIDGHPDLDAVAHLAAVNRSDREADFTEVNADLTATMLEHLTRAGLALPVVYSSTTHVTRDTVYAESKRAAEQALEAYASRSGAAATAIRFPNIFGKWSRPNYNSAIATFCHNLARGLAIEVHDESHELTLCYVDDAVHDLIEGMHSAAQGFRTASPSVTYKATLGEIAATLRRFAGSVTTVNVGDVGAGLERALYATFLSFVPAEHFQFPLVRHEDPRGVFAEFLRTPEAGQVSFLTAGPGVMRGSHYHHTKNERFLVVKGTAQFRFRCLATDERFEVTVNGDDSRVVQTIPGWVHDITNVGDDELYVVLWANENFEPDRPDTVAQSV